VEGCRKDVKCWLESDGFKVYGFTNPMQALEYFQNNYDKIDLVLSDILMRTRLLGRKLGLYS
jgi:hypothetical protein